MADYRTPGVYIVEKNAFPNQDGTVVAVATAIPVFIGYTEKAERNGKSLKGIPTKLNSLAEYTALFGGSYQHLFEIKSANTSATDTFKLGESAYTVAVTKTFRLYNCMRFFYANGGADCYILSVGDYSGIVVATELMNEQVQTALEKEFEPTLIVIPDALEVATTNSSACYQIYTDVLNHCRKTQNRMGIFDVPQMSNDDQANIDAFRNGMGANNLNYGTAYYPMLHTTIIDSTEVSFKNLVPLPATADAASDTLDDLRAASAALNGEAIIAEQFVHSLSDTSAVKAEAVQNAAALRAKADACLEDIQKSITTINFARAKALTDALALQTSAEAMADTESNKAALLATATKAVKDATDALTMTVNGSRPRILVDSTKTATTAIAGAIPVLMTLLTETQATTVLTQAAHTKPVSNADDMRQAETNFHQDLIACSPTYVCLMNELLRQLNELPPSAAMAGIYTMVDNTRGVWKAPANVALNGVTAPVANITEDLQANFNVDPVSGKSINCIRQFTGIGPMVWGARTLDGNSEDWRYINVRRTVMMIEQSIKLATRAYVFEPNTAATWTTVQSMISNFLTNLWKQGGLVGATPADAFSVQIGLGTTMTPNDILDGMMLVTVQVAVAHPAEFIVLTFQQQMQQS
jgi:uncharacterized protein